MDRDNISQSEEMFSFASTLWRRFFRRKVKELPEIRHSLLGYKAEVVTNNGNGTLTVKRPFESNTMTLRCAASLDSTAASGDQVLIVALGGLENAFILCKTNLSNL